MYSVCWWACFYGILYVINACLRRFELRLAFYMHMYIRMCCSWRTTFVVRSIYNICSALDYLRENNSNSRRSIATKRCGNMRVCLQLENFSRHKKSRKVLPTRLRHTQTHTQSQKINVFSLYLKSEFLCLTTTTEVTREGVRRYNKFLLDTCSKNMVWFHSYLIYHDSFTW